jgi:hypothetical protein
MDTTANIDLFATLGERLVAFGATAQSREVVARAVAENSWWQHDEVIEAVEAIRTQFLQREALTAWMAHYRPTTQPREVLVIAAGNIPLVGFFDVLCVVMSGHRCVVKPSSKDRVLMRYIVEQLHEIAPEVALRLATDEEHPDAVIATGSNNTNRYFRNRYADIPALLRGSRQSVALLDGTESEAELRGLERDIFSYSGLGCRNVSLLFLPRGYRPTLHCTATNPKYRNNYRQCRALLEMRQLRFIDLHGAVLYDSRSFPTTLSQINYSYYDTLDEVKAWLRVNATELQCVVGHDSALQAEEATAIRCIPFGNAQSPTLWDYADHRDTLRFLEQV